MQPAGVLDDHVRTVIGRGATTVKRAIQRREDEIERLMAIFPETGSVKDVAADFGISRQTLARPTYRELDE